MGLLLVFHPPRGLTGDGDFSMLGEAQARRTADSLQKGAGIVAEKKHLSTKYYEIILDWFKAQIVSGALSAGDTIPSERELAAQFGVSRVPVREALRILEYIGIIENTPDGMKVQHTDLQLLSPTANFATEITRETIENLFEVRIFLESAAAYYAATRRTEEDIRNMRASVQDMLRAIERPVREEEEMIRASHQFHFCVIAAAKNAVLENMYRNLYDLLEISKQYTIGQSSVTESTLMDHEAILSKIESGNAEEAAKFMRFHLSNALRRLGETASDGKRPE